MARTFTDTLIEIRMLLFYSELKVVLEIRIKYFNVYPRFIDMETVKETKTNAQIILATHWVLF